MDPLGQGDERQAYQVPWRLGSRGPASFRNLGLKGCKYGGLQESSRPDCQVFSGYQVEHINHRKNEAADAL